MKLLLPPIALLSLLLAACGAPAAPVPAAPVSAAPAASSKPRTDPTLRAQATITVTNTADAGPGSLRAALALAADTPGPDTIAFGANVLGTITLTSGELAVDSDVTIQGPGAAVLTVSGNDAGRVFNVGPGTTATISGLTITRGSNWAGGGLYNGGSLTLADSAVSGNAAQVIGGAGIYNAGTLTMTNTTVSGNAVTVGIGSAGGGIYNAGTLTMTNSTVSGNTARDYGGGGIYSTGPLTLIGSAVTGNHIPVENGGIYSSGPLTLIDSTVSDNSALNYGGIFSLGPLTMTNSTVSGNTASNSVGGIVSLGPLTMTNSTVSGNTARSVAGLYISGNVTMTNSTVTGNSALVYGGIIYLPTLAGTQFQIKNSIIAGNTAQAFPELRGFAPFISQGFNVIGSIDNSTGWLATDRTGTDAAPLDARLAPLADNGGPTRTHALLGGSPALAIVPLAECPPTDQRGAARPQGAGCDAGAFESALFLNGPPTAPTLTGPASPTKQSPVVVTWTAATDPDQNALTYTLEGRDANDAAFAVLGTSAANATSLSLPALAEGTWTLRLKANDGTFDGPYSAERVVQVDRTTPAAPGASVAGTLVNGWYKDSATVSFTPGSDPALPDGSSGSGTVFTTAPQTFATTGVFSASGVSRDAAGNESPATSVSVSVDASLPALGFTNCAPQVTIGSTTSVNWTASDTGSGLATPASGSVPLDTSTVGPKSVSVTSRDKVGHEITQTCAYTVVYPFGGFVGLQAPPNLNTSPYPYTIVTFTLGGNYGKEIYALGFPAYRTIDCTTKAPLSGWTPAFASTTTAGNVTQYDAATKRYQFGWLMTSSWTGCRELNLRTNDGVDHSLYFRR